jgi:hypothetical protein
MAGRRSFSFTSTLTLIVYSSLISGCRGSADDSSVHSDAKLVHKVNLGLGDPETNHTLGIYSGAVQESMCTLRPHVAERRMYM